MQQRAVNSKEARYSASLDTVFYINRKGVIVLKRIFLMKVYHLKV